MCYKLQLFYPNLKEKKKKKKGRYHKTKQRLESTKASIHFD